MIEEIRELYQYNTWANRRIFEAAAKLSPDAFTKDLKSSFSSVRETLHHLIAAEWIWLSRWNGVSPMAFPTTWDTSTHAALQEKWNEIQQEQNTFISQLSEERLKKDLAYQNIKGDTFSEPLWRLLRHLVNHSTYHRGQVTTLLRQLGAQAVSTDLVQFYREKHEQ
jgi:uncharacterized damage-inducible protein DinB